MKPLSTKTSSPQKPHLGDTTQACLTRIPGIDRDKAKRLTEFYAARGDIDSYRVLAKQLDLLPK